MGTNLQFRNEETLSTAITMCMAREWDHAAIAREALKRFSPDSHVNTLLNDIYHL